MLETAIETETSTGTADNAYRKLRDAGLIYLDDDKRYRVTGCAREIATEMAGREYLSVTEAVAVLGVSETARRDKTQGT